MFLGIETLKDHSQLPKRLTNAQLQAFRIDGGMGMSTPSLHRESTNSLISNNYIDAVNKQTQQDCCYTASFQSKL